MAQDTQMVVTIHICHSPLLTYLNELQIKIITPTMGDSFSLFFKQLVRLPNLSAFICFTDKAPREEGKYWRGNWNPSSCHILPGLTQKGTNIHTSTANAKIYNDGCPYTYLYVVEEKKKAMKLLRLFENVTRHKYVQDFVLNI